jgi:GT2 family glycosyltransferase/glycosyltransferase involved in cell wall biosynthesis
VVSDSQPYYISAPEAGRKSPSANLLHKLCSALNGMGFDAYLDTSEPSGELWTPLLTEATRVAHYKAGKKPVVVSVAEPGANLKGIGLQVRYLLDKPATEAVPTKDSTPVLRYLQSAERQAPYRALFVPALDLANVADDQLLPLPERTGLAFVNTQYLAAGGEARALGPDALDLTSDTFQSEAAICAALCRTRVLYAFEHSLFTDLARLCGCPVVLVPNAFTLKSRPKGLDGTDKAGVAWGESTEELDYAQATVLEWRSRYLQSAANWTHSLSDFVQETQDAASALPMDSAWPQLSVDTLDIRNLSAKEQGARADRGKYRRVNEQFERWSKFCTLREVDADIYAEHLATGKVPAVTVLIDQRGFSLDALADTLDSLAECLWRPAHVLIVSDQTAPEALEQQSDLTWLTQVDAARSALASVQGQLSDWVLVLQSGTRLAAQSLVEWGLATAAFPQAQLIYADDAVWQAEGPAQYPFFKPDANIELLRCTNYLGNALLVRKSAWAQANFPLFDGGLYGYALALLQSQGRAALGHIDTVLVHGTGALSQQAESLEFNACSSQLQGLAKSLRPLERLGTWLVEYAAPVTPCVSLVVPTGIQTGYLRSLLESLQRDPEPALAEVLLVCQEQHLDELEYALSALELTLPVRLVPLAGSDYSYAAALNAGVAEARSAYTLVCDDDTEVLHAGWLSQLLGIASQDDVGCVAPRLMSNRGVDARVSGGPLVLGVNNCAAPYNGEVGLLDECGVHSRLQLSQDVSAVAGNFFLFRKADWTAVNGFDVANFGTWHSVLDFCLRLGKTGKRHVWTPLSSVLHQGGKTVESLMRDTRVKLKMADADLTERDNLLRLWAQELANDPCYNRHLSLFRPFDIENTIVVDWQPRRKDRLRVMACPLTSGAGQYRVVEPLNALQDAGLAQTCAIIPILRRASRVLNPLELVRAAPDRLILQHSVDDAQLGLIEKYRLALPGIQIIQMVDDLLGEVPVKHPNRNFQVREGHQRMAQALKKSDRLVVTTETLKQHYQKYVPDVWLMPNCLDKQWDGLRLPRTPGRRLRVGWVGAGQHKGDLELITEVVRELAAEVDWVFMGMCTDAIKPHIKEFHDYVSISDYPKKMASLDLDIAIAPLEQNIFNECKSNLRLLEYGAMGWPVVCSDVFPYRAHNPPVLRCANEAADWLAAIRTLMHDEALRHRMGDQLHQWVQANFLLKNKAREWMRAIFEEATPV